MDPYAWPTESDAFALVPALSLAYYLVVRRHRVEPVRVACFVLAMLLIVAVFATPLETLALNRLLTAHFLQTSTVAEWIPALLVISIPPRGRAARARADDPRADRLARDVLRVALPFAYDFALRNPHTVLHLEHLTYLSPARRCGGR